MKEKETPKFYLTGRDRTGYFFGGLSLLFAGLIIALYTAPVVGATDDIMPSPGGPRLTFTISVTLYIIFNVLGHMSYIIGFYLRHKNEAAFAGLLAHLMFTLLLVL